MTQKDIFEIIKLDKTPYWSLYVVSGYNRRHVGTFALEGLTQLNDDEKIQKSIDALEQRLHLLRDEKNFIIKLKKSAKSNQDGVFEYQFVSTLAGGTEQTSGLGEIPNPMQLGYMPVDLYQKEKELLQGTLAGQMEALKKENELRIKALLNEYEVKRKLDHLAQKEKEVRELAKKYNSKQELIADTIGTIIDRTVAKWFGGDLSGVEEEKSNDERLEMLEDFANRLYDSQLSDEQLKLLIKNAENILTTQTTSNRADEQAGGSETD